MRFRKRVLSSGLFLTFAGTAFASPRVHRGPTSPHAKTHSATASKAKPAGPRGIDADRATQIQTALIKNGYLTGTPSGAWDAQSEAAMQKLQADNGWQTKLVPDARAIIKLGLGPTATASAETAQAKSQGAAISSPDLLP